MNTQTWTTLVQNFGVPGAFLAVGLWALVKGWVISKREADELKKKCADDNEEWRERYGKMEEEKNFWRDLALRATHTAEKATTAAQVAAEKLATGGQ